MCFRTHGYQDPVISKKARRVPQKKNTMPYRVYASKTSTLNRVSGGGEKKRGEGVEFYHLVQQAKAREWREKKQKEDNMGLLKGVPGTGRKDRFTLRRVVYQ